MLLPTELLVATNARNSSLFDMYRCSNIDTAELTLDTINPGDVIAWGVDPTTFKVRQALARNQTDSSTIIRIRDTKNTTEWRDLYHYPYGELGNFLAFCDDGASCWITSSRGRDTTALLRLNITTKECITETTPIYDERCDIGEVVLNKNSRSVSMASFHYEKRELMFFDSVMKRHFKILLQQGPVQTLGEIKVLSKTRDETLWLVSYEASDAPPILLFTMARDGLRLVAYLTRPNSSRSHCAKTKYPLVLLVHGGPWERDYFGFHSIVQWLSNRGYAVLQVNYRGSSGYGKQFLLKGDGQWGVGSMQQDLTDSVQWCIDTGITWRDTVCIFGASYGGYACLSGLAFTPDLFKCGVAINGPSNVKRLIDSIPTYWQPLRNTMIRRIGPVNKDEDLNRKISPYYHLDKIVAPLFLAQGANDPRVRRNETERIVSAMNSHNANVEYVLYPNEGHSILRPSNREDLFERIELFLAQHMPVRNE
eukprot:CAMPEP_0178905374 /NCGR_PEP_ID=MMETSP0786-20121207/6242_1 /TAXON_ID=186022 /ORGANISM="Thalassionema frauenfeldii, Strain CCMP 1798" /LENGTH=479 /DNA_ID=CAMNT_0020576979 /DNA_START=253 /DNA_END=1693 /DNA_ORIENTATION=+